MDYRKFKNVIDNSNFLVIICDTEVNIDGERYSVVEKGPDKLTKTQMKFIQETEEFNRGEKNLLKENYEKVFKSN